MIELFYPTQAECKKIEVTFRFHQNKASRRLLLCSNQS